MAMIFQLITMLALLALGFVLGRIWEIRRELRRDQQTANGGADSALADQVRTGYRLPTAYLGGGYR
jgi:hypothetical protein